MDAPTMDDTPVAITAMSPICLLSLAFVFIKDKAKYPYWVKKI